MTLVLPQGSYTASILDQHGGGAFRLNTKEENYHDQEIFDLDFIPDAIKMWVINNMNDIFGS